MSAGRLRVGVPSGPPFSSFPPRRPSPGLVASHSPVPVTPRRRDFSAERERRCESRRADPFSLLPWPNPRGIRLLSGTMQVKFLPAAPLPGGVKVARRPVKPFGVGASPTLAANFQGVMSVADGLVRNEEDGSAILSTLTISGRQADISWLHLSRKQDRHRRGRSVTDAFRQ